MDRTNIVNQFVGYAATESGDFVQGLTESIKRAHFLIKGRQGQQESQVDGGPKYYANDIELAILMTELGIECTTLGSDISGSVTELINHVIPELRPIFDTTFELIPEIYSILLCCEQPNWDDSYSSCELGRVFKSVPPALIRNVVRSVTSCCSTFLRFGDMYNNPAWLYKGTVQPEETGCVLTHNEKNFLSPLLAYAIHERYDNKLIQYIDEIGQAYGDAIKMKHSECEVEEYFRNFEVVKSTVAEFMKRSKADYLENGAGLLTEQFNANLVMIGEKYPRKSFGFLKKYRMEMITKYLKSGNEDDLDDCMLENHCEMLRNIYNTTIIKVTASIDSLESVIDYFASHCSIFMNKSMVLIHEEVD